MALIVISGKARAGKDTLAEILKKEMTEEYFTMAYADDLKRRVMSDFGLTREQVYGDLKEVPDSRYTRTFNEDGTYIYWTPREILQHMGTEAYRAVDNNFWINQLFKYIDRNKLKNVIVTDGRFPDEINAFKERGGYHIRVERNHNIKVHNTQHASEISLDSFDNIDFYVDNNGTLVDLKLKALEIKREIENGR